MRNRDDWRLRAACRDEDPELFFPVSKPGTESYTTQVGQARMVCAGCPVRQRCLQWALGERILDGVFGGLDELERAEMLRARRQLQPA